MANLGNRKRRNRLWGLDKKCYWCKQETILPPKGIILKKPVLNLATIDHLRTRLNPHRTDIGGGTEERTVLSCSQCNHDRGIQELANHPRLLAKLIKKGRVALLSEYKKIITCEKCGAKFFNDKIIGCPICKFLANL